MAKKKARTTPGPARKPATRTSPAARPAKPRTARTSPGLTRWPFLDDPNFAVISVHRVFDASSPAPVTYVVHDDDGSWQFLDGGDVSDADASVVALQTMMSHDPTLLEVATLPRGWYAVRRSPSDPWWPIPNGQSAKEYYAQMDHPKSAG